MRHLILKLIIIYTSLIFIEARGQNVPKIAPAHEDYIHFFHTFGIKVEQPSNLIQGLGYLTSQMPYLQSQISSYCSQYVPAILKQGLRKIEKLSPQKNDLQSVMANFTEHQFLIDIHDIHQRTLAEVFGETLNPEGSETVAIANIPFPVLNTIPIDLPPTPIYFEDHNSTLIPFEFRQGTSRGDAKGIHDIYQSIKQLAMQDKQFTQSKSRAKVEILDEIIHKALISRVQAFDHPIVHRLINHFKEICPHCDPLFTNNQDSGHFTFAVKDGKLLVKTSNDFLVRIPNSSNGRPESLGSINVERMLVFDLLTGEYSQELIHWKKLQDYGN